MKRNGGWFQRKLDHLKNSKSNLLDITKLLKKNRGVFWFSKKGQRQENIKNLIKEAQVKLKNLYGHEGIWESWKTEKENRKNQEKRIEADRSDLMTLSEVTKVSKYKREYIGYLVRQKKLKAIKINGSWMTKLEWVRKFEKEAREKLNLAKPGENVIIFPNDNLKSNINTEDQNGNNKPGFLPLKWWRYFFEDKF